MDDFGKYTLVKRLAIGGMAEVYLATSKDPKDGGRLLVIKRILPNLVEDAHFVTMFLNEARIAAQLNHPNIVRLFNLGKEGESYFLAMEYIHGEDLGALAEAVRGKGRLLPIPMVLRVVSEACKGLHYAHTMRDLQGQPLKLVHRDISPQNLMVSFKGDLKILDFGIARAANQASTTQTGEIKGKYSYIPPEQAKGMDLDCRSDVFSLGVVLYEHLTGTNPLKRDNELITLRAAIDCDIPPISTVADIPDPVAALVSKAICKDRKGRFSSALEFHQAIAPLIAEEPLASQEKLATAMKCLFFRRFCKEGENGSVDGEFSLDGFSIPSRNEMEADIGLSQWPRAASGKKSPESAHPLFGEWDVGDATLSNGSRGESPAGDETTSVALPAASRKSAGMSTVEFQQSFVSPAPDDRAIHRMLTQQDLSVRGEVDDEVTGVTEPNGHGRPEMPQAARPTSGKGRAGPLPRRAPRPQPAVSSASPSEGDRPSLPPRPRASKSGEEAGGQIRPKPLPHPRRPPRPSLTERPSSHAPEHRHTMVDKAFQDASFPTVDRDGSAAFPEPKSRPSIGPKAAPPRKSEPTSSPAVTEAVRPVAPGASNGPSSIRIHGGGFPASRPIDVIPSPQAGKVPAESAGTSGDRFAGVSSPQVAEISESQVVELSGSQIAEVSESQVVELSGSQIAEVSESQVVDLSPGSGASPLFPQGAPSDLQASGDPGDPEDFVQGEKTASADLVELAGGDGFPEGDPLPRGPVEADATPIAAGDAEDEDDDDEKTVSARGPDSRAEARRPDFPRRPSPSPTGEGYLPHFTEEEISAVDTSSDRRPSAPPRPQGKRSEIRPGTSLPHLGDPSSLDELSQQTVPQRPRKGRTPPRPSPGGGAQAAPAGLGQDVDDEAPPVSLGPLPRKQSSGRSLADFIERERRPASPLGSHRPEEGEEDTESHSSPFPPRKPLSEGDGLGGGVATPDSRPAVPGLSAQSMPSIVREVRLKLDKCIDQVDAYRKSRGLGWDTVLVIGIVSVILLMLLLLLVFL